MALISVHLHNSIDRAEELIINSDHIISVQAANENTANIQMTSGPTIRTVESVAELAQLISGGAEGHPALQLEYKKAEAEAEPTVPETAAERKARLKAEADAAGTAQ